MGSVAVLPKGIERRRYSRHKLIQEVKVARESGRWFWAMTFEISVGGLSIATAEKLLVGEMVHLSPVLQNRLRAVVRRMAGAMYGFEFLDVDENVRQKILTLCKSLPPFVTIAHI